jgi:cephalosporin hydroxylase
MLRRKDPMRTQTTLVIAGLCLGTGGIVGTLAGRTSSNPPEPAPTPVQTETPQAQLMDAFHNLVYHSLEWDKTTWLGVHAQQNPNDVWSYQQIFFETKPDFVVEAGANNGGGALVWATLLGPINPKAKVLTIDIEDKLENARKVPLFKEKVEFFLGSSTSDETFKSISERVKGKKTVVILDSDHSRDHVLNEMNLYGDLVSVGSYMLVQDTNIHGHPTGKNFGPGPWEAVDAFMAAGAHSKGGATFEIDRSRELLFFSMHPRGYLKRVK